ncbi:MAG TPA: hypothetical protein VGK90_03100 [Rhizomicrobium sp.]|jgi:hypothetical protein
MRIHAVAMAAALAMSSASLTSTAHAADAGQSPFLQPASTGSCVFKKTEYAASTSHDDSTSKTFVNLGDGGSITFRQAKSGCVAGTFFANAGNDVTNDNVALQVLLDNTPCNPLVNDYFFANSGVDFSSHSAGFFCGASVPAGTHMIQVQYASHAGGEVEFFQRTLVVDHR